MNEMDDIEQDELGVSDSERVKRKRIMDRHSGADLKKKWEQSDRQSLARQEEKTLPPRISQPRCHVCQSEWRDFIEKAITEGHSYVSIERQIPPNEDGSKVDRRSIANHYKEHMDLERQSIRAQLEEEARILQQSVDEGPMGARTDRGMLKVMAIKGFQDIIKGVTTVEPKDLIAIVKVLNELNTNASTARAEENEIALRTFVRAIQNVCPPELIQKIVIEAERIKELDDVTFEMEGIIIAHEPQEELKAERLALEAGTING
jgi:hypothetical protein